MKLTTYQHWFLQWRIGAYGGWRSREFLGRTKKDAAAIAALTKKGAVESDGEPGAAEMIRITPAGRAVLEERGDG